MRTLWISIACIFVANSAAARCCEEVPQPDSAHGGQVHAAEADSREIQLESIITSGPQKSLRKTHEVFSPTADDRETISTNGYLNQILQGAVGGASNVFLVDATNEHDAIRASFGALVGARATDKPVPLNAPNPPRGNHWLVAYLGSGPSSPTWWAVENVSIQKNKIRLSFRKAPLGPATKDLRPYFFWIPLGKLDRGVYELELYDEDAKAVSMMRRVTVEGRP